MEIVYWAKHQMKRVSQNSWNPEPSFRIYLWHRDAGQELQEAWIVEICQVTRQFGQEAPYMGSSLLGGLVNIVLISCILNTWPF